MVRSSSTLGERMKYVVQFQPRLTGTAAENIESQKAVLAAFAKWGGFSESVTVHQFVVSLDGTSGWLVMETDDPNELARTAARFAPWNVNTATPVLDITDSVAATQDAVDWLSSL